MLIVYGATAGVSVVQLYAGAFFPGLMLAGLYVVYVIVLAKLKPSLMPPLSAADRFVPLPPLNDKHGAIAWHAGPAGAAARR
jgi:TRAP-type mannitol/chloroaromatic compound transport system permease large subunit